MGDPLIDRVREVVFVRLRVTEYEPGEGVTDRVMEVLFELDRDKLVVALSLALADCTSVVAALSTDEAD